MLQTRKVGNGLCAVSFNPAEIMVRKCGRDYYKTEKALVSLCDGKLIINDGVANEYGIEIIRTKA